MKIPALREREGDVRLLAKHFLEKFNREKSKSVGIDSKILKILETYIWRGNVRELENLVELLVVTVSGGNVSLSDLPEHIVNASFKFKPEDFGSDLKAASKRITEKFEREFISEHLAKNHWNISKTAGSIGISRSALHAKMKEYNLE